MPIVTNSLYSNPQISGIVSNLATAIYGDPEARMKRDYYAAESDRARAAADKSAAEARGVDIRNNASSGIAGIFDGPGTPSENFRANFSRVAPLLLQAGGGNADQLSGGLNNLFGTYYGLGDDNDMTRASVLQGHTPGKDFAPSVGRADAVAARDAGFSRQEKEGVANIQAGASRDVANINQGGALDRLYAAPVVARPGEDVYLAPNDPRRSAIGTDGVVHGQPLPGPKAPPEVKPHTVTGKNLNDAIMAGAALVKGATSVQPNGKIMIDPDFESSFDPAVLMRARDAAGAVLAKTGNAQQAGQAYLQALGVPLGASFGSQGGFFGIGGHKGIIAPAAAPAAASPAPTVAPVRITGDADYARLPPGASYIAPDGSMRTKR